MASTIPILWSDDIKVDIVTPLAILRAQTGAISQMTKGLLAAEVTTTTGDSARVRHHLDLIAPVLNGYRHRILAATHEKDLVYPVTVEAECFMPKPQPRTVSDSLGLNSFPDPKILQQPVKDWRPIANTEQEFIELVSKALRSGEVRSIIQSLIARSNERQDKAEIPPQSEPEEEERPD